MSLISLSEIQKFYGKQDVLRKASLQVGPGERVGLVGPNGAGKSTIMRLILGQETPDGGAVHKSRGLRLGYLPQDLLTFSGTTLLDMVMDTAEEFRAVQVELDRLQLDLEAESERADPDLDRLVDMTNRQGQLMTLFESLGGYTLEAEARKILSGLGFTETDAGRGVAEFSGGWIMRAVLARLLLAKPELLLLDEPTNHLDIDSLLWLEGYLKESTSALLLVSHDRVFLNQVATRIVEVDRGRTVSYTGNYDRYLEEKERRQATESAAFQNQQDRIRQMEKFIEKNRVRASTARRAQSTIKMLDKMEKLEAPKSTESRTFRFHLPPAARPPDILVELAGVDKSYGDLKIYENLDFTVRRGDRIAFLGANGKGKSTLLKLVAGSLPFEDGQRRVGSGVVMSYFAQFQLEELNPHRTVLEELEGVAGDMTVGRLRSILGSFLFSGEDVFKKVAVLSGGEKSRLILAKIMIVGPNLLLLDEPSNHLDIPGREMLEQALEAYDGTLCLISHDRLLVNTVANKVLVIDGRGVEVFPGNFDDYHRLWKERVGGSYRPAQRVDPVLEYVTPKKFKKASGKADREAQKKTEAEARRKLQSQRGPLAKELARLEARQAELDRALARISADLASPETYQNPEKTRNLNVEYGRLKAELDQVTAAWEDAALKLEEIDREAGSTGGAA